MVDRQRGLVERIDAVGGRLYSRTLGTVVVLAVTLLGLPMLVGSVMTRNWVGVLVVGSGVAMGLAGVRHLFSRDRRLSELE